ncbi:hypothetical protein QBC44DRAFT_142837 [Cladorrhinum sp. PSN332]|nr:hypothetical protein QBC44DRAFT_142837 [Cladorrhinum sp. PSN332]
MTSKLCTIKEKTPKTLSVCMSLFPLTLFEKKRRKTCYRTQSLMINVYQIHLTPFFFFFFRCFHANHALYHPILFFSLVFFHSIPLSFL